MHNNVLLGALVKGIFRQLVIMIVCHVVKRGLCLLQSFEVAKDALNEGFGLL